MNVQGNIKQTIIVFLILGYSIAHFSSMQGKVCKSLAFHCIDSVEIKFYHSLFTNSDFLITIKKDAATFILDTLSVKGDSCVHNYYSAQLSEYDRQYLLLRSCDFFISKNLRIFKYHKKAKSYMSSDNQEITISIHKGNEVKKERYVLGDIYAKRPLQVEDEINQYTPEFSKYAQFITYITAKQGPHNIRYDSGIQQMISDSNYVVYDFCEGAENALPLPQIKKLGVADDDRIYEVVEHMPSFPGGADSLSTYINSHFKYPKEGICFSGRIYVQFIVEKDGSISDVRVLRPIEPCYDKEVVRMVKSMPKWIPGKQNGIPVRVKYVLPVFVTK